MSNYKFYLIIMTILICTQPEMDSYLEKGLCALVASLGAWALTLLADYMEDKE